MNALSATLAMPAAQMPGRGALAAWASRAVRILRQIGPYAAIEIILPGGTLIAVGLWLWRRYQLSERLLRGS